VIPDLKTSDVQLKGPPAEVHRDQESNLRPSAYRATEVRLTPTPSRSPASGPAPPSPPRGRAPEGRAPRGLHAIRGAYADI